MSLIICIFKLAWVSGFLWAEIISMNVGQVADHVVTSREVLQNLYVEKVLFKTDEVPTDVQSKAFTKKVSGVLLEWVVYLEAKNFSGPEELPKGFQSKLRLVKGKLTSLPQWRRLEVSDEELHGVLKRKLMAKDFINFKASSSMVPITDAEALKYYTDNKSKFGNEPFKNLKESIKGFLNRQQVDTRLKAWFEILRSKYNVKNQLL